MRISRRGRRRRYARRGEIERMGAEGAHSRIWFLDMAYEFPWEMQVGGSVGFFCSIAPPRMARLLARTGELTGNTRRRIDDTNILMWETFRNGFAGERGRAAVRQMNRIHRNAVRHVNRDGDGTWSITEDEYLFVLAAIMVNTVRGVDAYGWRPFSDTEREAAVRHFREMGQLMGLTDLPDSYTGFERFHDDFARRHIDYTPEAAELWASTRHMLTDVLVGWVPARLHRWAVPAAEALAPVFIGPELRRAFGLRPPAAPLAWGVRTVLRLRAAIVRRMPPREESAMPDAMPTERFPTGEYEIPQVGPEHSVR